MQARPDDAALKDLVAQVKPVIWENAVVPAEKTLPETSPPAEGLPLVDGASVGVESPAGETE
jgi:hypothetical protein